MDDYLLKHFEIHGALIEFYVSSGLQIQKIGEIELTLTDLIDQNTLHNDHTSAVIHKTLNILDNDKEDIIGKITYKARMRFPISQALKWRKQRMDLGIDPSLYGTNADVLEVGVKKRDLVVSIVNAKGLHEEVSAFVTYQIYDHGDEFTNAVSGSDPRFNFRKKHVFVYNEKMIQYLKET